MDFSKKLYKSKTDKKICGVLGGFSEYFGIDSTWLRVVYILLTCISFGTGVIAYVLFAFAMPDKIDVPKEASKVVDTDYKET